MKKEVKAVGNKPAAPAIASGCHLGETESLRSRLGAAWQHSTPPTSTIIGLLGSARANLTLSCWVNRHRWNWLVLAAWQIRFFQKQTKKEQFGTIFVDVCCWLENVTKSPGNDIWKRSRKQQFETMLRDLILFFRTWVWKTAARS